MIIGLTGGIGTGKSTVSKYLAEQYHFPILDADLYAREAVVKDAPILKMIHQRYGNDILNPDGSLNRQQLGAIIFSHHQEKIWLEQQIHPYVKQRLREDIEQCHQSIIVAVIPLLFEADMTNLVTKIWVVSCSPEQQLQRLMERNHLPRQQAQARIQSQWNLEDKVKRADLVLDNSSTPEHLYQQIAQAVNQIRLANGQKH